MFRFVSLMKPMSKLPKWRGFSTPNLSFQGPSEDHRKPSYKKTYFQMFLEGVAAVGSVTGVLLLLSNKHDMSTINNRFTKIEANLARAETREERFITQFATIELRMKESEVNYKAIHKEVGTVKKQIDGMKKQIGGMKGEIGDIKDEIGDIKDEIGGIKGEIHGLSSRMDTMATLISDLLKETKAVNSRK